MVETQCSVLGVDSDRINSLAIEIMEEVEKWEELMAELEYMYGEMFFYFSEEELLEMISQRLGIQDADTIHKIRNRIRLVVDGRRMAKYMVEYLFGLGQVMRWSLPVSNGSSSSSSYSNYN